MVAAVSSFHRQDYRKNPMSRIDVLVRRTVHHEAVAQNQINCCESQDDYGQTRHERAMVVDHVA